MQDNTEETFYPNGKIRSRIYFNATGEYHRNPDEGPAIEGWFENGQRHYQYYYVDGELHRDSVEGPALEAWDSNGQKIYKHYLVHGQSHRDPSKGPSFEYWGSDGKKYFEEYYVDGKEVPKPEVDREIKNDNKTNRRVLFKWKYKVSKLFKRCREFAQRFKPRAGL